VRHNAGNFGGVGGTAPPDGMAAGLDVAQEKIDGIRAHLCEAKTLRREAGTLRRTLVASVLDVSASVAVISVRGRT